MKKKRKKYTQEFKEEAVKLITEQGYQITEAARNLGVNEKHVGTMETSDRRSRRRHKGADMWIGHAGRAE
jgi:transposase